MGKVFGLGFSFAVAILAAGLTSSSGIPPLRLDLNSVGEVHRSGPSIDDVDGNISKASPRYRLPNSVIPEHYDLEIQPILDPGYGTRFTAPGNIRMLVSCQQSTSTVSFHAYTLNVTLVRITRVPDSTEIPISTHYQDDNGQVHHVMLNSAQLLTGQKYEIYVEFVAPIPSTRTDGLYLSSYIASNGQTRYLAVTDFEADDCRRMTPVFDEPAFKATWNVSVIRKTGYHSLANNRLLRTEPVDGLPDWRRDVYEKVGPLPSYLLALAVSDFKSVSANEELWNGRPVTIWGPPPLIDAGAGTYSPDLSANILAYFERLFQTDSGLLKMDKISIPDYNSGAMENWGLNTYLETRLLYLEGESTVDNLVRMTNTISHEIVHQWFGNLVTMRWWNDLHLNEGFATYFAPFSVQEIHPEYLPMEHLVINTIQPALQADVLKTSHPVSNDGVESEAELSGMFSTITYHKGGSLLRMMHAYLSNDTFLNGLAKYLEQFKLGNAVQNDLFTTLTSQARDDGTLPSHLSVEGIMESWTKKIGFPVVRATRKQAENKLELSQEKYFPNGPPATEDPTLWFIPITYNLKGDELNLQTKVWLNNETRTTEIDVEYTDASTYILVNPAITGFYRVLYDAENYQLLKDQLEADHEAIDALSRSALIDDALNLGFIGVPGYVTDATLTLDVTKYLNKERHLVPWVTFLNNMAFPYRLMARVAAYLDFKNYILGLVREPLTDVGFEKEDDSIADILLRARLVEWACNLGDPACIAFAQGKFRNWTLDPSRNEIAPDLRPTVYCTAMANGGDAEWNFIVDQYKVAHVNSPSKSLPDAARIALVRALGCSKQSYRLAQLLNLALDQQSFLLPEHRVTALQAVAGNSIGVHLTFNFIRNNFQTLTRRFGVGIFSSTVTTLGNYLNSRADRSDLEDFVNRNAEALAGVRGALDTALESIDRNIAWMGSTNLEQFKGWLANNLRDTKN